MYHKTIIISLILSAALKGNALKCYVCENCTTHTDAQLVDCENFLNPTTSVPVSTTSAPASTTSAPASTTSAPVSTTSAPASTTSAPASTTSAPISTTSAPESTTSEPASTTSAPASTTSAPISTTSAPESTTSAPASTTSAPASTTSEAAPTTLSTISESTSTDTSSTPNDFINTRKIREILRLNQYQREINVVTTLGYVCVKGTKGNDTAIVRSCALQSQEGNAKVCAGAGLNTDCLVCNTDKCNMAVSEKISAILLFTVIMAHILKGN